MRHRSTLSAAAVAGACVAALIVACVGDDPMPSSSSSSGGGGREAGGGGAEAGPPIVDDATSGEKDAALDALVARCDTTRPFGAPVELTGVNTPTDEAAPALAPDEQSLLYAHKTDAGDAIWTASRSGAFTFTNAAPLPGAINTVKFEDDPFLTDDGKTLYFSRGYPLGDLFVATRAAVSGTFDSVSPLANVSSTQDDGHPFVTADGQWLYFRSTRTGKYEIFRAKREGGGSFGAPSPVTELNTEGDRNHRATLTADQRTLYFTSNRGGGEDIYVATRDATGDAAFGNIRRVDELRVLAGTLTGHVSADGCVIVFAARPVSGAYDLYLAQKPQ